MLSRDAQNLYWMTRYIERGIHVCRLLANQLDAIHDRPTDDIDLGWRRLYRALGREPIGAGLMSSGGDESFMLMDSYTLTDDLAFERLNPSSVIQCFALARENARQVRNVISHDMWSSLNVSYLEIQDRRLVDIWNERPREYFVDVAVSAETFRGIAATTMYRDPGWHFFRLGQFVERALLTCALLDAHLETFPSARHESGADWASLLDICAAGGAFRRQNSIAFSASDVLEFLVADQHLPNSIGFALQEVEHAHSQVASNWNSGTAECARREVGRARAMIRYNWPERSAGDDDEVRAMLGEISSACRRFSDNIEAAYLSYTAKEIAAR